MRYQLAGDTYARGAFVQTASPAEFKVNTSWQNSALKDLL